MQSPGCAIICEGVSYAYRSGEKALADISLKIAPGEFAAVVGHNGSGKSTLAMLLSGLEKPGTGTVLVDGIGTHDAARAKDIRNICGIVFQNPENQIVFEKVHDDIAFGLKNRGMKDDEIEARVAEVSRQLGIEKFSGSFELSMGQKQRVAIAGVLAANPRCVIFDEPTAMLDPRGKKEIHRIIVDLHRAGLTVVYVTNLIDEVLAADRIILLSGGRIAGAFRREDLPARLETLRSLGLETPFILEAAEQFRARGLAVTLDDYTLTALVDGVIRSGGKAP
ncbi:MAG: ATP-binding cassette domain-containing protein [Spirochaetaceae bacterium]|jgi:energy-coupling factor transport system ATP-binding protein|nr:ATP-binding cassette domain-containing protein [Spirochaetaceae bacterium]